MSVGAIIFSRLDSKRLPRKALLDISGREMLGRVIDRAKCIRGVDNVIVATSSRTIDDPIASFALSEGVNIFRGNVDDVAERALGACKKYDLTKFARICGDRPFFVPEVITRLIAQHNELGVDITTTMFPRTYPPGLTGEVISTVALEKANLESNKITDKEHITSYFYRHSKDFSIYNLDSPENLNMDGVNLAIDDETDLARARWITDRLGGAWESLDELSELVRLAKEWNLNHFPPA